eukprot:scaffold313_cov86-Isochrysis_galbana.AAC.2
MMPHAARPAPPPQVELENSFSRSPRSHPASGLVLGLLWLHLVHTFCLFTPLHWFTSPPRVHTPSLVYIPSTCSHPFTGLHPLHVFTPLHWFASPPRVHTPSLVELRTHALLASYLVAAVNRLPAVTKSFSLSVPAALGANRKGCEHVETPKGEGGGKLPTSMGGGFLLALGAGRKGDGGLQGGCSRTLKGDVVRGDLHVVGIEAGGGC